MNTKTKTAHINHTNLIYILIGTLLLIFSISLVDYIDNDYWFLKATGDEILSQGKIPDINPFFIISGKPIVIQQWAWCVFCSFLSHYGNIGTTITISMQMAILEVLLISLFKVKDTKTISFPQAFLLANISIFLCKGYMCSIRPECITTILLVLQVLATEKYIQTKHKVWLAILPLTTLIEINFHSSMWFMHFCVLVPYFLPFWKQKSRTSVKPFIIPMALMTISLFANPIGYKAILFVFESFTMGTFKILKSSEMYNIIYGTALYTVPMLFAVHDYILCIKNKMLRSEEIYIAGGLSILILTSLKSAVFVPVMGFYLFPYIPQLYHHLVFDSKFFLDPKNEKAVSKITNFKPQPKYVYTVIGIIIAGIVFEVCKTVMYFRISSDIFSKDILPEIGYNAEAIAEYIKNDSHLKNEKEAKIMTHFDVGGYFEAKGFRNLYLDARPESYAYPDTSVLGDMSIWEEYAKLNYNCSKADIIYTIISWNEFSQFPDEKKKELLGKAVSKGKTFSDEEIEKILNSYQFDYYIIDGDSRLYYYFQNNDNYEECPVTEFKQITKDSTRYYLFKNAN